MAAKKILFISWQGAMGHVTRDLAIARELRTALPDVAISWMAHPLAARLVEEAGERLLPESARSADYNRAAAISVSADFKLNLFKYVLATKKAFAHNVGLLKQVIAARPFDLVIGDESYEVIGAWSEIRKQSPPHFVLIQDFIGLMPTTWNPVERIIIWKRNRDRWLGSYLRIPAQELTHLFMGEPEDVPDRRFGFLLDNRRTWANKMCRFLGYIVRFNPAEYRDQAEVRAKLGYGPEPLLICTTGGTFIGQELLELGGRTYPLLKEKIPDLRMVFVRGELRLTTPSSRRGRPPDLCAEDL
jgi:UDP:flavonoid glycosyltransferase YjiC (YdhE family)